METPVKRVPLEVSYSKPPPPIAPDTADKDLERLAEDMARMSRALEREEKTPSYLPELKGKMLAALTPSLSPALPVGVDSPVLKEYLT